MTFPIGTCPSCGGKRIWVDRSFNPYPRWAYIHKRGCVAGKHYPDREQERHHAESGSCPVHGLSPATECDACYALADADQWTPE